LCNSVLSCVLTHAALFGRCDAGERRQGCVFRSDQDACGTAVQDVRQAPAFGAPMSEHIGRRGARHVAEQRRRGERRRRDDAADPAQRARRRRAGVVAVRVHAADIRRVPSHDEALSVQRHHGALLRRREARQRPRVAAPASGTRTCSSLYRVAHPQ